jgi:hypothetical protein
MQCLPTASGLPFKQDAVFGMSARCSSLGQNRPLGVVEEGQRDRRPTGFPNRMMSALPPKADIAGRQLDVRFVPKADICAILFDHLVGDREQPGRHFDAKRARSLQVEC